MKSESAIKKEIQALMLQLGAVMEIIPTGTYRGITGGGMYRVGTTGRADLMGVYRGCPLAIEVKEPEGKQAQAQKDWADRWVNAGGKYVLARSVDDMIEALKHIPIWR